MRLFNARDVYITTFARIASVASASLVCVLTPTFQRGYFERRVGGDNRSRACSFSGRASCRGVRTCARGIIRSTKAAALIELRDVGDGLRSRNLSPPIRGASRCRRVSRRAAGRTSGVRSKAT